jgi:hypothetical protein
MDLTAPITQQNKNQMSTCFMFHPNPDPTPENITKITAVKTVQEHNEGTEKFTALFVALLLP